MTLFNFSDVEMLSFFMVLVRWSVLFSVLPFLGDRFIPAPVKILLPFSISIALFPALILNKQIDLRETRIWGATVSGIISTLAVEVFFSLLLGYTAKLIFQAILFGTHLVGNFMGFASATFYDPHQESQTEIVSQLQVTIAMLIFFALDGHHLMLRASLDSYRIVGIGKACWSLNVMQRLISMSSDVFSISLQIAAPISVASFSVNSVFGIISKAMPQMNILSLSLSITALVGLFVLFLSLSEFHDFVQILFSRMGDWMLEIMKLLKDRG